MLSLESRRATEIERLIRSQRGEPFVAPSMREVPLADNPQAFEFAEKLFRGEFEMMILLTGVGTRLLNDVLSTRYPEDTLQEFFARPDRGRARIEAYGGFARMGHSGTR